MKILSDIFNIQSNIFKSKPKNVEIGSVDTPTDDTADGGGITLLGATNKTITWVKSKLAWVFNQAVEIAGNLNVIGTIKINGTQISTSDLSDGNLLAHKDGTSNLSINKGFPELKFNHTSGSKIGRFILVDTELRWSWINYSDNSVISNPFTIATNAGASLAIRTNDVRVTSDLVVTGTVNGRDIAAYGDKLDSIVDSRNIDAEVTKIDIAKLIDVSVQDEEVILAAIPTGYRGSLFSGDNAGAISISHYQSSQETTTAKVTFSMRFPGDPSDSTYITSLYGQHSESHNLLIWAEEGTTIRAKVTTAGTGYTGKHLIKGTVYLYPIT